MSFPHYHQPAGETMAAHAIWPKMNMKDPPLFQGHVGACECGRLMFWPDDKALKPVEVEHEPVR